MSEVFFIDLLFETLVTVQIVAGTIYLCSTMSMVKFTVEDRDGSKQELEAPTDMGLSLMETLKAFEYNIMATCGGMALCATCHVKFQKGQDQLSEKTDAEWDMLDTLPDADDTSRLACQIRLDDHLEGAEFKICGDLE
jgi:2Fe-2S ferredoxin